MNDYQETRRAAQTLANQSGRDYGLELLGGHYRYFALPNRENRSGHELRCEVVMCETLGKCAKGHGPKAVDNEQNQRDAELDGYELLDGADY